MAKKTKSKVKSQKLKAGGKKLKKAPAKLKKAAKKTAVKRKQVKKKVVKKKSSPIKKVKTRATSNPETFKQHVTSLRAGDLAPGFSGIDQHNNKISLSDFFGKTLVLYFYPKDDTSGCTAQSCSLRDEYQYLTQKDFAVVGVSADNVRSHQKFAEKFSLPFPLIADVNMDMIKAYDVWGQKMLFGNIYDGIVRTTFIIRDGIIVRVITDVDTAGHGKQVQEG
jgi:peroxiredoxin Q/BCP